MQGPAPVLYKAPVAQLDRVPGYEPGGREFESLRARQATKKLTLGWAFLLHETPRGVSKTPDSHFQCGRELTKTVPGFRPPGNASHCPILFPTKLSNLVRVSQTQLPAVCGYFYLAGLKSRFELPMIKHGSRISRIRIGMLGKIGRIYANSFN